MNEFIGDLYAQRSHEVRVAFKKSDMFVIGDRNQRVDLDGEVAPILEEQLDRRHGQFPFEKLTHEGTVGDPLFPALDHLQINFIDVSFGVVGAHFDAKLGCNIADLHLLR